MWPASLYEPQQSHGGSTRDDPMRNREFREDIARLALRVEDLGGTPAGAALLRASTASLVELAELRDQLVHELRRREDDAKERGYDTITTAAGVACFALLAVLIWFHMILPIVERHEAARDFDRRYAESLLKERQILVEKLKHSD